MTGAVAAQEEPVRREPTFVRVLDAAHKPLAGATVTFVGCRPEIEHGPTERVDAVTDARGRVTAKLRADLCHAAWASGPVAADGSAAVSQVIGFLAAGAMFELECGDVLRTQRVPLLGLDAWRDRGPFTALSIAWNPAADLELTIENGFVVLPPLPLCQPGEVAARVVELRDRDGQPLGWWHGSWATLELAPPQRVDVVTVDEHGKPVAGATLRHRVGQVQPWRLDGYGAATRNRFRELGVTDAEGRLQVTVPHAEPPLEAPGQVDMMLFADAPGRAQVVGGVRTRMVYVDDRRVSDWQGGPLRFTLTPAAPLEGRCGGLPAGTFASLQVVAKLRTSDNGFMHDHRAWSVPVDGEGRFRFERLPAELHSARVSLWHPRLAIDAPVLQAESGRKLSQLLTGGGPTQTVTVQVRDALGGPARGGVLQVGPGNRSGTQLRYSITRVPLDTAGTARLRLAPGAVALLATSADGYVAQLFEVKDRDQIAELRLQPFARMPVRLLDERGEPIAGATVRVVRATTRGSSDPVLGLTQGMESHLRWRLSVLRTDAEGRLTIPFAPIDGLSLQLALEAGAGSTHPFLLEPGETEVVMQPK